MNRSQLMEFLDYDPERGKFTWKVKPARKIRVGDIAGCKTKAGYIVIGINGELHYAHQLAWLFMTGRECPRVDHRDCDGSNNEWSNLREATPNQNAMNSRKPISNTSGYKGVTWHKGANKWVAQIWLDGKHYHLGLFDDPSDAHDAYMSAAEARHPEFARAA